MRIDDIPTPAPIIDIDALDRNLELMAGRLPGQTLRPHVKAHKCTALAARQSAHGHSSFTCATPREVIGMMEAGVGDELLLANQVVDVTRLRAISNAREQSGALVHVAVDSTETIDAAAQGGITHVVIDVEVGMPRCGVRPEHAGALADYARRAGLEISGVMGYEGHLQMVTDVAEKEAKVADAMRQLRQAHDDVGGAIVSAGGTGTHTFHHIGLDHPTGVTDVQAGSYALLDTQYATLQQGFEQALIILGTVISTTARRCVADVGLKSLGMDHGNPTIADHSVWFCSDEHITFSSADEAPHAKVGDRVAVTPAHIDPTLAMHPAAWVVRDGEVIDRWEIDLRYW